MTPELLSAYTSSQWLLGYAGGLPEYMLTEKHRLEQAAQILLTLFEKKEAL